MTNTASSNSRPELPLDPDDPGVDLATALVLEDDAEDTRDLHASERITCHTCQAWADDAHIESPAHKRAIGVPASFSFDHRAGYYRHRPTTAGMGGDS